MLKSLLSIAVLATAVNAQAMTDTELGTAMRKEISKSMVTLKAPKIIFHWVDASDITPAGQYNSKFPATFPHFKTYVEKQGRKVYNKRSSGDRDIEGPGMYMASDPLVSRHYGGKKSFGLIVGVIAKGARIIPNTGSIAFSPAIKAEIEKRGCSGYDYLDVIDTYETNCNKVKQLMIGKDASFAEGRLYSWGSEQPAGCSGSSPERDVVIPAGRSASDFSGLETFVVYNTKMFSNIYGYTHKTNTGDSFSMEVLSYLKGLQTLGTNEELISAEQMKDSSIPTMSAANVKKFSQKHIFGCQP